MSELKVLKNKGPWCLTKGANVGWGSQGCDPPPSRLEMV